MKSQKGLSTDSEGHGTKAAEGMKANGNGVHLRGHTQQNMGMRDACKMLPSAEPPQFWATEQNSWAGLCSCGGKTHLCSAHFCTLPRPLTPLQAFVSWYNCEHPFLLRKWTYCKKKAISGQETSQAAVPISHQALQAAAMGLFARRWHCGHTIVPVTSPASQRSAHGCHRTDCAILQSQSICSTKHARNCFSLWSLNVILEITAHLF